MKSPFQGMDPFIESSGLWEDFHSHFIELIATKLAATAPARYLVRTGERSYVALVESEGNVQRRFMPDVKITSGKKRQRRKKGTVALARSPVATKPMQMRAFVDEEFRETFVEIYEADPELRLVTSIEVLSPSNKRPDTPGWDLYQRKRKTVLLAGVNLVEIDLVREGQRMPMLDEWPESPYALLVTRSEKNMVCSIWPAHFRLPLPPLPIPLARPDPDIQLQLQPMIDGIYRRFRYDRSIDYHATLSPPLSPGDAAWLARRARRRS